MNKNTLFIALFLVNFAFAAELKSFSEIKREFQSDGDASRLAYIFNRCASLYLVNSALGSNSGNASAAESFEKGSLEYMKLIGMVEKSIDEKRKTKRSDGDRIKSLNNSILIISKEYQDRMNVNYARTGNYITDDIDLMDEIKKCQDANKLFEWMAERN